MSRRGGHRPDGSLALVACLALLAACDVRARTVATVGAPSGMSPGASSGPALMLPDLRVRPPRELRVAEDPSTRERQIRFSTSVFNIGGGPLEVSGVHDRRTGRTIASQRIRAADGSTTTRAAGSFVFHPQHDHWHFEDFTSFELWTHDADGSLERLVSSTGKMSFCIWDSDPMAEPPAGAPSRSRYLRCPQDIQGLSVGWVDTYSARTQGQHLTIEGVPNGTYAIRSTVDPVNRLIEVNETNNDVIVYIRLAGSRVERVAAPKVSS